MCALEVVHDCGAAGGNVIEKDKKGTPEEGVSEKRYMCGCGGCHKHVWEEMVCL